MAIAVVATVSFLHAGRWLVAEDRITRADVALVLSGNPVLRSLAAAELYKQGKVDRVVVIPEPPELARQELIELGLLDPELAPISERILVSSGVPRSRLEFLPEPADGTITEALRVRAFFAQQPLSSVVVVTSKFASRRARWIFRHVLSAEHIRVLAYPSPKDPFEPDRWWSKPRNALTVVTEYQKLCSNALTLALHRE